MISDMFPRACISFPRYWDNCAVSRGFVKWHKKSKYLRRVVGLKEECLFKSGGRVRLAPRLRCFCLCQWLLLALYRLRALEGGRWQYTHDFCLTLCFLWGGNTQLYTVYVCTDVFSICFHGCDASVFVLLDFTMSFKVTVRWGFTT